jgi:hypothetical protein
VVPTLLTWPGSAIVHDIKGENWTLTAGWRARFGPVLLFDPTNAQSAAYNPLLEVRRGEWEVRDVQNIADVLCEELLVFREPQAFVHYRTLLPRHPHLPRKGNGVTHVSGTICHLCLGPLTVFAVSQTAARSRNIFMEKDHG